MELESELRALAAEIEWPHTPALRPELAPRRRPVGRDRRLVLAIAVALVAVALAAAFAVPQSRGAILRFLGFGSVRIEFVDRLPAVQERPLAAGLGPTVSAAVARDLLGRPPLLPPVAPALHAQGGIVSLLFLHDGNPVLLSEVGHGDRLLKKIASASTSTRWQRVGNDPAIWIAGDSHIVVFPRAAPRLAGHVLVWQHGNLTLRLEGAHLGLRDALTLAAKID
jgi:hypothetical protein